MSNVSLPVGYSIINAVAGALRIAVIRAPDGTELTQVVGIAKSKEAAHQMVVDQFYDRVFDHRTVSRNAGTRWIRMDGEKSKRVAAADVPAYVAAGWSEGKGETGPRNKVAELPAPAPASA